MKLIITGVGGWIGRKVAERARMLGLEVAGIDVASSLAGPWTSYRAANIASDTLYTLAGDSAFTNASAVIHCAGHVHRPNETPDEVALFHAINFEGTGRVLELAQRLGVGRVVYLSSIAFYDWSRGCDFDEEGLLASPTAYAESKLAGERLCRERGLDWRVARLGTVFGTGDRANFAKLAGAMARGRFLVPGQGDARKSVLPVSLAAELLVDLALRESVPHRLVNLALPVAPTLAEICDTYTQLCGFPRAKRIPLGLLRLLARFGDGVARLRPDFPLTSVNVRKLTTSTTVNTDRMLAVWPSRRWGSFEEWLAQSADFYRNSSGRPRSG